MSISAEQLRELLEYDPASGVFRWKVRPARNVFVGATAGVESPRGYIQISIGKRQYRAHRLAWLYIYGHMPEQIDHINGIRSDNRLCNLRPATASQNAMNRPKPKNNTTGVKGVYWNSYAKKYAATITVGGRPRFLGYFSHLGEAAQCVHDARSRSCGEFANHGSFVGSDSQ